MRFFLVAVCFILTPLFVSANEECTASKPCELLEFTQPTSGSAYQAGGYMEVVWDGLNEDVLNVFPQDRVRMSFTVVTTEEDTPGLYYQKGYEVASELARELLFSDEREVVRLSDNSDFREASKVRLYINDRKADEKFHTEENYQLKATFRVTSYRSDSDEMKAQVAAYNELAQGYVSYSEPSFKIFNSDEDYKAYMEGQSDTRTGQSLTKSVPTADTSQMTRAEKLELIQQLKQLLAALVLQLQAIQSEQR